MNESSEILENLINSFAKLPGIGRKTARRLAYFIINSDSSTAGDFARSVIEAKNKLGLCSICYNLTEHDTCEICRDNRRDTGIICVVENFSDLYLFEKLSIHKGSYHVLGGLISPLDGINPSSLKLSQLFDRIDNNDVSELIIGLNHSVEGDTTALYIADRLKNKNIKISRLATGIPIGGEIEYTDEITLKQAFRDRKNI
ncbi:TPA: recombination protein RecR [Candidatus Delongbacteria bacterium]|nr:MAG: recombination protein RecR [Candidatus Delongbacteria bacterium GWF2_40_14]HAQ60666.1 recombination protein RecR [Candidatus Delongbacteria bacterium]